MDPKRTLYETPEIDEVDAAAPAERIRHPLASYLAIFLLLYALWIVFSGKFDAFHLILGVLSCVIVTVFSGDLLFPEMRARGLIRAWLRFLSYLPWLLYQIFLANMHVLYLVLHPRMMERIDPQIIRFQSTLGKEMALVTLANSITLTPGTITVSVSVEGEFKVHAIDKDSGQSLPGEMEGRIARAFGEKR
jgi:multicomponent Na+:H+ antiporter subunit E